MIFQLLVAVLSVASAAVISSPAVRVRRNTYLDRLTLPDNATSIRENIATSFSCQARSYGYYADTENDCQLFHVCLPVVWGGRDADGAQMETVLMWSFICPQETVFNQEKMTCARPEDSIPCSESTMFYSLNDRFGEPVGGVTEELPSTSSNFIDSR